jgi:hypothetical protein
VANVAQKASLWQYLERLSARPLRCVLVVASDQIGPLMADRQLSDILGDAKAAN